MGSISGAERPVIRPEWNCAFLFNGYIGCNYKRLMYRIPFPAWWGFPDVHGAGGGRVGQDFGAPVRQRPEKSSVAHHHGRFMKSSEEWRRGFSGPCISADLRNRAITQIFTPCEHAYRLVSLCGRSSVISCCEGRHVRDVAYMEPSIVNDTRYGAVQSRTKRRNTTSVESEGGESRG